jgi:phosphatidylserine synthase
MNAPDTANIASRLNPMELHNRAPWNNVVCGLLVFSSRWFVSPIAESSDWNLFWTGIAIVIIALTAMIAHGNIARNYWSSLNVLAGLWLIVSTRVILPPEAMTWAQICLGVLAITIALTSLANERQR